MMHHPNMHHQAMSGHPPQHMPAHQGIPGHHQMPPHQLHRENRHVTLTRVPLGPSGGMGGVGGSGGLGAHGGHGHGQIGGLGALGVHGPHAPHAPHAPHSQRPPHAIHHMHHTPAPPPPQPQHHNHPPTMKPMRRPYLGGGYGPGPGVMPPPYAPEPHQPEHAPAHPPQNAPPINAKQPSHTVGLCKPPSPVIMAQTNLVSDFGVHSSTNAAQATTSSGAGEPVNVGSTVESAAEEACASAAAGDSEANRSPPTPANSKEKTPMCLVNELARYNKIKHQYRLTSETGPAHKKVFTVTLRLGDTEEYTAEGSSIKRAQHAAASSALAGTGYPPPSPRAPPTHPHPHPAHRHAVMPTVELNALAMKLCQPAVYTSIPPVPAPPRMTRTRPPAPFRLTPFVPNAYHPRMLTPGLLYRVRVCVGGRAWLGEGATPQAARHDAAARALADLRPKHDAPPTPHQPSPVDNENGDAGADLLNSEVKSPVSLVHELALKRNLSVLFTVKSERGPPHMRVFVTACTVGDMETEGEGNGKKVSKRRAAEKMLEEMRRRWPPALLRARPPHDKRKPQPTKKKPRNLIKEGGTERTASGGGGADNPISRLAVARHAVRARSPQYRVLEERGAARRREFVVQCDAPPHSATGQGPNKKTAKRRAAHNVLLAMEISGPENTSAGTNSPDAGANGAADVPKTNNLNNNDIKRKDGETTASGGASNEVRQPVPGVLLMDYHQRSGQPTPPNGVSETSATGGSGGNTPGAKDQLMYLSQLLGFTVQFSDFPKRNHGEYLSLVSLSTEPPVMCHGGGPSTQHSHEQCSRAALRALALMGLDAPTTGMQAMAGPGPGANPSVITNGISE
ncbi:double-stranded RNA-binding protein Staufen homolog 2 isoform X2 [Hyposmocoma kahamanoa]|uniref:double-stranded RNA-binding protein Staufen homolog 2 isoform X2 n=1 Tax=Hyposmocoma kahamanoa TaxID=1477025 RepID=UPI000E6D80E0|nr:double-stranded RNA-binding protein Staufen homolog 2 isoform X2 [Hyposmocoma kahamanoa]